jgi:GABA(A) receptor-associated protein
MDHIKKLVTKKQKNSIENENNLFTFKNNHTFEQRTAEALRIKDKYPNRIPVIVQVSKKSTLDQIEKCKYLVPSDLTMAQLIYVFRKRIKLAPEKSMFVFVNQIIPTSSAFISQIYHEHKDKDGFLYILICEENTFGLSI